jgi:xylulokinase
MARRLNLKPGTPVCAGGVDCVVAMLGLGVVKPGQHVAIIGTSMTWGFLKEGVSTENRLISMPYVVSPEENSFVFGGASTAAAINKWLRDTVAGTELYQEKETGTSAYELMDKQASEILPGSEGLIVLPYFMGERSPIWNVDAKGVIFGLTLNHTKAHIFRAFLESVAYSLKDTMDNIQKDHLERKIIISGGVAKSTLWKQIFADVTGCEVVTPQKDIEANFGDVILAGIGTGTISLDQAMTWVEFSEPVLPNKKNTEIYNRYFKQYKSIYENLKPNMAEISVIAEDCQPF